MSGNPSQLKVNLPMPVVLITGGTGTIGKALSSALLKKNYEVIILTRDPMVRQAIPGLSYSFWDPGKQKIDPDAFSKADHIIHLAGAGVADKRWSPKRKAEIHDSRVKGGELLVRSLKELPHKISSLVSSSAIGWYGADPSIPNPHPFIETDPYSPGFLGETCRDWEGSISSAADLTRIAIIRIGIVLSNEGGALKEFKKPLRFKIAAVLGNGKQIISWIHVDDLVRLFIQAMEDPQWKGVYNGVAPMPVSNRQLTLSLAKAKGGFYIPAPVPAFVLKIVMGEMSVEVLKSATVSSLKTEDQGFQFRFRTIDDAMEDLMKHDHHAIHS